MELGIVGLGRMGADLARDTRDKGHVPVGDRLWARSVAVRRHEYGGHPLHRADGERG
jgi:6-phosphogluconate dehydrogenase (decarboxylating)